MDNAFARGLAVVILLSFAVGCGDDDDEACTVDTTYMPEASAKMRNDIPNAKLLMLQGARHCGVFELHGHFNTAVQEFVAACAPSPAKAAG